MGNLLLLINLAATLFMAGVIWFVQLVHYPLFGSVGEELFADYQAAHKRRTTWVVISPMVIELVSSLLLVRYPPALNPSLPWVGLGLVGLIWLSTILLQIPKHRNLEAGFDARAHRLLVATNWIRTAAWSVRAGFLIWASAQVTG